MIDVDPRNVIYFENGIKHYLTDDEMDVVKTALNMVEVEKEKQESLENLRSLFFEFLD